MKILRDLTKLNISEDCLEEIIKEVQNILEEYTSHKDEAGNIQFELIPNEQTGRNLKQEKEQEEANKKAAKEAKANISKNPNRVAGGKKAHQTKIKNQQEEVKNRPIFQALNYNPLSNGENK